MADWELLHKANDVLRAQVDTMLERVSGEGGVLEKSLVAARHNGHGTKKADTMIAKGAQKRQRFMRRG
jgi:hypothetical protein